MFFSLGPSHSGSDAVARDQRPVQTGGEQIRKRRLARPMGSADEEKDRSHPGMMPRIRLVAHAGGRGGLSHL